MAPSRAQPLPGNPASHLLKLNWRALHQQALPIQVGRLVVAVPGDPELVWAGPFPNPGALRVPLQTARSTWATVRLYARDSSDGLALDTQPVWIEAGPASPEVEANVSLGVRDRVAGLENTRRGEGTDGENEPALCGPEERSARRNYAQFDPTPDLSDIYMYFNVTDPTVKSRSHLLISATVFDEAGAAETTLALHYTSLRAEHRSDVAHIFTEHPRGHLLRGDGRWKTLTWEIDDAGFRTWMMGTSDFRLALPRSLCVSHVSVLALRATPVEVPRLKIEALGEIVVLSWSGSGYLLQCTDQPTGGWREVSHASSSDPTGASNR